MKLRYARALLVPVLAVAAPAALTGRVVTQAGRPIAGARACLVIAGVEELCSDTGTDGAYMLPASASASGVRITARGYLPLKVAAAPQAAPIVLDPAAALVVRLRSAVDDQPVPAGRAFLVYTSGRRMGPFPVNRTGLLLQTIPPGEVRVVGEAEGLAETTSETVDLVAGATREVVLRLPPRP
jgi:hypothetical protein